MFACEKNYSCCDHQYWDRWDDVDQDAKECGHLVEVRVVTHSQWQWDGQHYYCPECAYTRLHDLVLGLDAAYCPRCGADMEVVKK